MIDRNVNNGSVICPVTGRLSAVLQGRGRGRFSCLQCLLEEGPLLHVHQRCESASWYRY